MAKKNSNTTQNIKDNLRGLFVLSQLVAAGLLFLGLTFGTLTGGSDFHIKDERLEEQVLQWHQETVNTATAVFGLAGSALFLIGVFGHLIVNRIKQPDEDT